MSFIKKTVWLVLAILIVVNFVFFLKKEFLSRRIEFYEKEIIVLNNKNSELNQAVLKLDSLNYAASMAAKLGFVKKAEPIVLDKLFYAFRSH